MTRHVTDAVRAKIEQWEGLRLTAYRDSGGVWTIGYGHTGSDVHAGLAVDDAKADALLAADLAEAESAVETAVTVSLSDNQFGALVSFAFNIGETAFRGSTLLKRLNTGSYDAVPAELAKWNHAGGKVVAGLTNRRAAEAGLWAAGAFVAASSVLATPRPLIAAPGVTLTQIVTGVSGGLVAANAAARSASVVADQAKATSDMISATIATIADPKVLLLLAAIIIGGAVFTFVRHRQAVREAAS